MPKFVDIPDSIKQEIEQMLEVHEDKLNVDLQENVFYESYISRLIFQINDKLIELEDQYKATRRNLLILYTTSQSGNPQIDQRKWDAKSFNELIDSDPKLLDIDRKRKEYENVQDFYDKTLKSIRQKSFDIRSIIEFKKFLNGGI